MCAQLCSTFVTPWTIVCQAPLSMEFSRQEYWSGLLLRSPGALPNPGMEPTSPALASGFFITGSPGKVTGMKGGGFSKTPSCEVSENLRSSQLRVD